MNRVMVLDDDSDVGLLMQGLLEPDGFAVSSVDSAALLASRSGVSSADIFILDIGFPGSNWLDMVRRIREHSTSGIIVLSNQDSEAASIASLELGADDFVIKPFRPRELAARVKAVHRRTTQLFDPSTGDSTVPGINIGTYRLIAESRSVVDAEGVEIKLTTAEFNILRVLADHRGEVLHRDDIIGLSKGRDWRCYERSVDGLISRLRRKLPVPPGTSHFIKTVHGRGYTIASA